MNTKQQIVATVLTALISASAVRAQTIEYSNTFGNLNWAINSAAFNASSPSNSLFTKAGQAAQDAESASNLKQLMLGAIMYTQDFNEKFPPMQNMYQLKKAILPYVKNEELFRQPGNRKFYVPNATLSKKSYNSIFALLKVAAIYEAQPGSDGKRAVGFADGHVKRVTAREWAQIKKDSGLK